MQKIGPYTLEARLGTGGSGEVYRSSHPVLAQPVAIKLLHGAAAHEPALRERFLREARLTLDLSHPGIINLYDIGQSDGQLYIVMELFEDGSLADAMQQSIPLPVALDVGAEIAEALAFAHSRGVIHGDIKPSNVLLRPDGRSVLADFGLATDPATRSRATGGPADVMGTVEYMAPEQIEGREADVRSDVYQFGALLYELVAGRIPFDGPVHQIIQGHLQQVPPPLSDVDPALPAELDALVTQMLAKDPAQRPAQMASISALLRTIRSASPSGQPAAGAPRAATGPTVRLPAPPPATYQPPPGAYQPPPAQPGPANQGLFVGSRPQSLRQLSPSPKPGSRAWGSANLWFVVVLLAAGIPLLLSSLDTIGSSVPEVAFSSTQAGPVGPYPATAAEYPAPGDEYPAPGENEDQIETPTREGAVAVTPISITLLAEPLLTDPRTVQEGDVPWSIGSVGVYQDAFELRIYGVMRNDGDQARNFPSLRLILRDESGAELLSKEEYPFLSYAGSGDYLGFRARFDAGDGELPSEGAYVVDYEVSSLPVKEGYRAPLRDLQASDTVFARKGGYSLVWSTTVTGPDQVTGQTIVEAIFFNDSGQAVGVDSAIPDDFDRELAPGESLRLEGNVARLEKFPSSMAVLIEARPAKAK